MSKLLKEFKINIPNNSNIHEINKSKNDTNSNVKIINGKLLWNNDTTLGGEEKIKKEIKEFKEIKLSFKNKNDFIKRESPLITLVITLFNQENNINIFIVLFKNKN